MAIVCIGQWFLSLQSREGNIIMVRTLYYNEVDGTIISPMTVIQQNQTKYYGINIEKNCDSGKGTLTLKHKDGTNHTTLQNGSWFHHCNSQIPVHASIQKLNNACHWNLWNGILSYVGESVTTQINKHVIGIKRPIATCLLNKKYKNSHKRTNKKSNTIKTKQTIQISGDNPGYVEHDELNWEEVGEHFHIDVGFVWRPGCKIKQENVPTVTSIDKYNSYLIIVDRITGYLWLFLTTSKSPPIEIARIVLRRFKCSNPHRSVGIDQGKEIGKSAVFQKMIQDEEFVL